MDIGGTLQSLKIHAKNQPNKVAVIYENEQVTYRQLYERVNAVANSLLELGMKNGDHASLYMKNRIEMLEIYYALATIGAVAVPINYMIEGDSLPPLIERSDSTFVFVEEEQLEKYEKINNQLTSVPRKQTIVVGKERYETYTNYNDLTKGPIHDPEIEIKSNQLLTILYSSGTTSDPKGIMVTHQKQIYRSLRTPLEWDMNKNSVMLITVPIYHAVGHSLSFQPALMGSTVVIIRDFDPEYVLKTIDQYKVTHSFFVPVMYQALLQSPNFDQYDYSSLRLLISAGAPLTSELKKTIMQKFNTGLLEFFGSSETSAIVILHPEHVVEKADSVGQQANQVHIRLVDDHGKDVAPGEEGEFAIKGPTLFDGYYNMPEVTKESYLPDGYFLMGDMGRMDEDGFYYLLDRKKDMIISGGVNVYPKDIEEIVIEHPSVLEVAVVGKQDEKWGEVPKAFIVLKKGADATATEIIDYANRKLAKFQHIKDLTFVSELPRNPSGKVLKYKLREMDKKLSEA